MQAMALSPSGPYRVHRPLDRTLQEIMTALGPTMASLGTGELCGVLTDSEQYMHFYCYNKERDLWIDRSELAFFAGLGPRTSGKPGLAYHRYRTSDGAPVTGDASRGAVYLAYTEYAYSRAPDNPRLLISEWLNAQYGAFDHIYFRWQGNFGNQWTNLAPGTGVALYEDDSLWSLQALVAPAEAGGDTVAVDYLPFADGNYDASLGSGNDFQVMERGICLGLRGQEHCGDQTTAAY